VKAKVRVRKVYGRPWSELAQGIVVSHETLLKLGECLVSIIVKEAKKDFAKRGWSGKDPMKGPSLWDSFSYHVRGKSTLEITSSFYGLRELTTGDIPMRRMPWLSQEYKSTYDGNFHLTPAEKRLGMRRRKRSRGARKRGGAIELGRRLPLVVPIKTKSGTVIFRTAPLKTQDAWIHPGIAKFTFMQRAIKKGRQACADILMEEVLEQLSQGDPTK